MEKDTKPQNGNNQRRQRPPQLKRSQKPGKNLALFLVLALILAFFLVVLNNPVQAAKEYAYSEFLKMVANNQIDKVEIIEREITGPMTDSDGKTTIFSTYIPYIDSGLLEFLKNHNVTFSGHEKNTYPVLNTLIGFLPWLLIIGLFWFLMFRQIQGPGNKAMAFGKSRAKLVKDTGKKVTFADVAGAEEAKTELQEVIEFLKEPGKFTKLGAKIPKGVLLVGPPGTGKTLLARAIAGEANVPFFNMSGSDFVEMFVGVGASRVRDLFEQGKKHAPCILFIDELDAVGRSRGAGWGGGHDEREQTLNQMLVEMDGFNTTDNVIVIAATNRPDVLDSALLRPGRFDRQVIVDAPDVTGREGILKVHLTKVPMEDDVNVSVLARGTPGFTGADLANMVNEGALLAARFNKKKVGMEELEEAKDKVLMGPERKSMIINDEEKTNTAYHESGHTLLGQILPKTDPIHKVTIIPRGRALGLTQSLPVDEKHSYTKSYLHQLIMVMMGGRIAEEYKFGEITNGSRNDIERATKLARAMVCEWGMSDLLGPITYGQKEEPIFIGKEIARHKDYSEDVAKLIDVETKKIIDECYAEAKRMIYENKDKLEKLAQLLLEKETIDVEEVEAIVGVVKRKHKDETPFGQKTVNQTA